MNIGENIRKIRELKGYSQEYLASQLNISPQAFGKIERGETRLDFSRLAEIAAHLKVNPLDIINFDEGKLFGVVRSHELNNNTVQYSDVTSRETIVLLQKEIENLRTTNELLMRLIELQTKNKS